MSFALSGLRLIEFQTSNYDLGLFQQALWSATHGRGFFESADFSLDGASSLLRIHPAFVLYLLAQLYAWAPTPWTLFAVQSALAGTAAIPLFLLARDVTGSPRRGLATALLYLAWTPILASNLFDFHLEVFLPIELFTLFYVWRNGRYAIGFGVALLAMFTFEAGPFFVFLTALFFLAPPSRTLWDRIRNRSRSPFSASSLQRIPAALRGLVAHAAKSRATLASIGLIVASVLTFAFLLAFESTFGSSVPNASQISLVSALQGGPPQWPLGWMTLGPDLVPKVTYWLLLYALVAFIPLWAPRTAILSAPWIVASLFAPSKYTFIGSHYGFLFAFPIFVGVAYGLRRFPEDVGRFLSRLAGAPNAVRQERGPHVRQRGQRPARWVLLLVMLLGVNLLLGPADPVVQFSSSGNGYHVSYNVPVGFASTLKLVQLIPPGASILASDDLMPLVANDVNAYGIYYEPANLPYLPFDLHHLPQFVLLSEAQVADVPNWMVYALSVPSDYGLRATVGSSAAGMILLYQMGYGGSAENLQPAVFSATNYTWPALSVGPAGRPARDPPNSGLIVVQGMLGLTGNLWYGPYVGLATGDYSVTVTLRAMSSDPTLLGSPNTTVLEVDSSGFASPTLFKSPYSFNSLSGVGWTRLSFHLHLASTVLRLEVRGYQLDPRVVIELASVLVARN